MYDDVHSARLARFAEQFQRSLDDSNQRLRKHYTLAHIARTPDTCQCYVHCIHCDMALVVVVIQTAQTITVQTFRPDKAVDPLTDRWISDAYRAAMEVL